METTRSAYICIYTAASPSDKNTSHPDHKPILSCMRKSYALLHAIVQMFASVAQKVESTFVVAHSSFFAIVGVVDQLGLLHAAPGSVLGLFGLLRWLGNLQMGARGARAEGLSSRSSVRDERCRMQVRVRRVRVRSGLSCSSSRCSPSPTQ